MYRQLLYSGIILLGLVASLVSHGPAAADVSILIYHRFGEGQYPSTNTTIEQLEQHIEQMQTGGYEFLTLTELSNRLIEGQDLPDKGLVITIDDAFRSFAVEGWPRFKAAGIPVTLFVSTDPVDQAGPNSNYLTWPEIKALGLEGVRIGHHAASHKHLPRMPLEQAKEDIARATAAFKRELGFRPDHFAYPYGEFNAALAKHLETEGFLLGLAQYSSAVGKKTDRYALPRFPMNERYGTLQRFKLVSRTLALPVKDILPRDPELKPNQNPPLFGFTLTETIRGIENLNCYPSHLGEPVPLQFLDAKAGTKRVEVRFEKSFPKGRSRINCTMQHRSGRWYWFGQPFFVPGGANN